MILDLYLDRSETAIAETSNKYGSYCHTIAANILGNTQDAEECVNDTYMKAWNVIPPERPLKFKAFLGKVTRNIALNKYEAKNAKRRGGDFARIADEFEQCLPSAMSVDSEFDARETGRLIDAFLRELDKESRVIFVRRYWYGESVKDIAARLEVGQGKVKSSLFRTRNKLKAKLESEGVL